MYKIKVEMPSDHQPSNPKLPYWLSGMKGSNYIYIVYIHDLNELSQQWPDGIVDILEKVDYIIFTSRYPKPVWFKDCMIDHSRFYHAYKGYEIQDSMIFKEGIPVAYCTSQSPYAHTAPVKLINEWNKGLVQ